MNQGGSYVRDKTRKSTSLRRGRGQQSTRRSSPPLPSVLPLRLDERSERILLLRRQISHVPHAESSDLLHWEYLPVILAPEEDYDGFGCFSGSCETLPDGRHLAIYTGVAHSRTIPGKGGTQTQNIAIGDGLNYEKYAGNPVITPEMLPEGSSFTDFRDPKIWRCKDGSYRTVIAAMDGEGHGIIVLFSSEDGLTWKFENVLAHDTEEAMWECPDIFDLDGVGLFLTSQLNEYWQGSVLAKECKTMYFVGECGEEVSSFTFDETSGRPIDLGLDFYAPQTMVTCPSATACRVCPGMAS